MEAAGGSPRRMEFQRVIEGFGSEIPLFLIRIADTFFIFLKLRSIVGAGKEIFEKD